MFERYTLSTNSEDLEKSLEVEVPERYAPRYNAAPTGLLPVITNESPEGISFFYWGLPPSMAKNKSLSQKLINADVGQLFTKPSYRNALKSRRCLVPSDGLYYWKKTSRKSKVPYRFTQNDQDVFLMAGIWDEFEQDGTITHTFNIITKPALPAILPYSPTMPLILDKEFTSSWLSDSSEKNLEEALAGGEEIQFGSYPVSSKINNIELDQADLIKQSYPMDQFGNYSLFD